MISSFFEAPIEVEPIPATDAQPLAGLSVLLAEDVLENQLLITRFLQMAGARVDVVSNGLEAVAVAGSGHHDIVLMDLQMPVLDGYGATTRLRKEGYGKPIIAVTAHALNEERQRCLQVGFNDHLTKPIDRVSLIDRVIEFTKTDMLVEQESALTMG
jgi:CheY-like chemotaxis protein